MGSVFYVFFFFLGGGLGIGSGLGVSACRVSSFGQGWAWGSALTLGFRVWGLGVLGSDHQALFGAFMSGLGYRILVQVSSGTDAATVTCL